MKSRMKEFGNKEKAMKEKIDTCEKYWLKEYGSLIFYDYGECDKVHSYVRDGWKGGIEYERTFDNFWRKKYGNMFFLTETEKESVRKITKKAFEAARAIFRT